MRQDEGGQLTESKGHLAYHPVVAPINTNTPDDETDSGQNSGGISQPEAHLRLFSVVITLGKPNYNPVTKAARTKDLRDKGTNNEANI